MREIKFRGKCIKGEWAYGSLLANYGANHQIWEKDEYGSMHNYLVYPESIGQYTGFKIKNKEIYEGDILSCSVDVDGEVIQSKNQVYWGEKEGCWMLDHSYSQDQSYGNPLSEELEIEDFEIIGNIYESKHQKENE